ncbi:hypothetical protein U0L90_06430 [Flavobacteriaceae sp. LMIT009]
MKKLIVALFFIACTNLLCSNLNAQDNFAKIEKNVHNSAKDLFHDLNKSKDTLILKGGKRIRYVYSINTDYKRETQEYINDSTAMVSLTHLSKGKHVFVVEQMPKKIVFVVRVLQDRKVVASNVKLTELPAAASSN